jgi:hypothetical protein
MKIDRVVLVICTQGTLSHMENNPRGTSTSSRLYKKPNQDGVPYQLGRQDMYFETNTIF